VIAHYIQVRELMFLLLCFCRTYYKMYIWYNYLMTMIHLYCDKFYIL